MAARRCILAVESNGLIGRLSDSWIVTLAYYLAVRLAEWWICQIGRFVGLVRQVGGCGGLLDWSGGRLAGCWIADRLMEDLNIDTTKI